MLCELFQIYVFQKLHLILKNSLTKVNFVMNNYILIKNFEIWWYNFFYTSDINTQCTGINVKTISAHVS